MKKQILIYALIYGLCGGLLIAALKVIEYRYVATIIGVRRAICNSVQTRAPEGC